MESTNTTNPSKKNNTARNTAATNTAGTKAAGANTAAPKTTGVNTAGTKAAGVNAAAQKKPASVQGTVQKNPAAGTNTAAANDAQKIPSHDEVARYSRRHRKDDGFGHVLLFYVLPFIVVNTIIFFFVTASPKFTVEASDTENYLTTQLVLTVDSHFPLRSVTATLDGEELPLEKSQGRTYVAPITTNGVLEATVTNINGMSIVQYEHVDILDDTPPAFEETLVENGVVTLTISDSQSGLNFDSVYALDSLGQEVKPISSDPETNTFSFALDPDGLYVHAQDIAGNEVQGTFTSHLEGTEGSTGTDVEL